MHGHAHSAVSAKNFLASPIARAIGALLADPECNDIFIADQEAILIDASGAALTE